MDSQHRTSRPRLWMLVAGLLAVTVCVPAVAMTVGQGSGLNVPALLAALFAVLVVGLYLQSTRKRMT